MKNKLLYFVIYSSVIVASSLFSVCYADVVAPTNVDPGVVNKDIDVQYTFPSSNNSVDIDVSKVMPKETLTVLQTKKFKLNSINYTGNTVFKTDDLNKISKELVGKDVTLDDLNNVANTITNLYRKQGYITTKAYVPPQIMKDGIAQIQVVEGKIGDIKVEGSKWVRATYIKNNILKKNDIDKNNIFNVNDLSNSLSEVNRPSYLKGNVTLEKGKEQGQTDIVLDLKDRFPLSFEVGWSNQGQELVGTQRAGLYTSLDNVTGFGDKLWANNTLASGTYGLDTGYSLPLGIKGNKLSFGYSFTNTNLGQEYRQYNINGVSDNFETAFVHPLFKGKNFNVESKIAFDMMHSLTSIYGNSTLNHYEDRALRTGISANRTDSLGRWLGDFTVSTGIPLLGATKNSTYGQPDSVFVKFNTNLTRVQKLPYDCLGIMRASTQFATSTLLPSEQMQIGGAYTVRGYNENVLLGDTGYTLSFEGRTPIPFLPKTLNIRYRKDKSVKLPIKDSIKFAMFYDQGLTAVIQQNIPLTYKNFLQSVGTGLRINIGQVMTVNLDLGVPLGRDRYTDQNAVRFHFSMTTNVF
jgi:hemolysin activation/secretion protein